MLDLAIIIVSYNTKQLTKECLESVFKYPHNFTYKVVLVDNDSADGSVEMVKKEFPKVTVISNKDNVGFAKANNQAIAIIAAKNYLLLNSDTVIFENTLNNLMDFVKSHDYGVVSTKLLFKDKSFQPSGGELPTFVPLFNWLSGLDDIASVFGRVVPSYHYQDESRYPTDNQIGWIGGTAMLITKETIEKIGVLDDKIFMYAEDVDYCWRAADSGVKVGWTDTAQLIHYGGASTSTPHLNQWRGEFRGLLYLYKKRYGQLNAWLLKILFYIFIAARILAFGLIGRFKHAQTYAKVFVSI